MTIYAIIIRQNLLICTLIPKGGIMEQHEEHVISEKEYHKLQVECRHALNTAMGDIQNMIEDLDASAGRKVIHTYSSRIKSLCSINEKMGRKKLDINRISDIAGIRIVCIYKDDIRIVSDLLDQLFPIKETQDYLTKPKSNGYRSIHKTASIKTLVQGRQKYVPIEIQIRSALQDAFWSQEHIAFYKSDDRDPSALDKIRTAADRLDALDESMIKFRDYEKPTV